MPRSKAQQLERLRQELQKCQGEFKALKAQREAKEARFIPSLWTLVSWNQERDRRNEAIRKEATQRAIANISLGAPRVRPRA